MILAFLSQITRSSPPVSKHKILNSRHKDRDCRSDIYHVSIFYVQCVSINTLEQSNGSGET